MTAKKIHSKTKHKNPWKVTTIAVHYWIVFWVLVLATMALATICFSNAFQPIEGEVDSETAAAFEAIRENLEMQVEELQGQIPAKPEGRMQVAASGISPLEACDLTWNQATATMTVAWSDQKTKTTGNLPYSFDWGNDTYTFVPFEVNGPNDEPYVSFGPGSPGGACGVSRDTTLTIDAANAVTPSQLLKTLREDPSISNIRQRTISGIPVISYTAGEAGGGPVWYAFGRTYSYNLSSQGWLTDAEAVKIIQSLRVEK